MDERMKILANAKEDKESNTLLTFLRNAQQEYQKEMRVPQAPDVLKQKTDLCNAIESAITIVEKLRVTHSE